MGVTSRVAGRAGRAAGLGGAGCCCHGRGWGSAGLARGAGLGVQGFRAAAPGVLGCAVHTVRAAPLRMCKSRVWLSLLPGCVEKGNARRVRGCKLLCLLHCKRCSTGCPTHHPWLIIHSCLTNEPLRRAAARPPMCHPCTFERCSGAKDRPPALPAFSSDCYGAHLRAESRVDHKCMLSYLFIFGSLHFHRHIVRGRVCERLTFVCRRSNSFKALLCAAGQAQAMPPTLSATTLLR